MEARIELPDTPVIVGRIKPAPKIVGKIVHDEPVIIGRIIKDRKTVPEPMYEVSNEYGITLFIGE